MTDFFRAQAFLSGAPGSGELLLLFVLILLLFGPRKLPEISRTIARVLNDLRRASQDFRDQIMTIDHDVEEGACEKYPGEEAMRSGIEEARDFVAEEEAAADEAQEDSEGEPDERRP